MRQWRHVFEIVCSCSWISLLHLIDQIIFLPFQSYNSLGHGFIQKVFYLRIQTPNLIDRETPRVLDWKTLRYDKYLSSFVGDLFLQIEAFPFFCFCFYYCFLGTVEGVLFSGKYCLLVSNVSKL